MGCFLFSNQKAHEASRQPRAIQGLREPSGILRYFREITLCQCRLLGNKFFPIFP